MRQWLKSAVIKKLKRLGSRVWIGGFNRKLETFCLIRSKKETSRIVNEQNWAFRSASFLFSCLITLYSNVSLFPFFFAKKRTFYFILKSALFHKTGRFSKKFKHGPFNWKFPIKRKTKSSLPALGGTFFSRFCRINRKGSWYTVSLATLKKLMAASLC